MTETATIANRPSIVNARWLSATATLSLAITAVVSIYLAYEYEVAGGGTFIYLACASGNLSISGIDRAVETTVIAIGNAELFNPVPAATPAAIRRALVDSPRSRRYTWHGSLSRPGAIRQQATELWPASPQARS